MFIFKPTNVVLVVGSCRPQRAISLQSSHLCLWGLVVIAFLTGGRDCSLSIRRFCEKWERTEKDESETKQKAFLSQYWFSIPTSLPRGGSSRVAAPCPSSNPLERPRGRLYSHYPAPSSKISSPPTPKVGLIFRLKGLKGKFILTREGLVMSRRSRFLSS